MGAEKDLSQQRLSVGSTVRTGVGPMGMGPCWGTWSRYGLREQGRAGKQNKETRAAFVGVDRKHRSFCV